MNRRSFLRKALALLALPFAPASLSSEVPPRRDGYGYRSDDFREGYRSDHYDGKEFFHPRFQARRKSFLEVMKWRFNRKSGHWPESVEVIPDRPPERVFGSQLRVSWVGHATVLVQTEGVNLLFDPQWEDRASPVSFAGPSRVSPPGIAVADLPPLDAILITHNHYDHLSIPTLKSIAQAQEYRPIPLITPLGNGNIIRDAFKDHPFRITELDWEETFPLNDAIRIILQPAFHWSIRLFYGHNTCLWGAFVVQTSHGASYFAGDTGFGEGKAAGHVFRETRRRFGPFRFSMIPIGAYEPRDFMKDQHINPQEAVRGAELLESRYCLGIHLHTFQGLTDEGYEDPPIQLKEALAKSPLTEDRFRVLPVGGYWEVPEI